MVSSRAVRKASIYLMDVEMAARFGVAGGAQVQANNVLVKVELVDGTVGVGEAAPFPAISGETQASTAEAAGRLLGQLVGSDAEHWATTAQSLQEAEGDAPAARCACETALLDACARSRGQSLFRQWGGREAQLRTDLTLSTGTPAEAATAADQAARAGFTTLKLKVGAGDLAEDAERFRAALRAAPDAAFILDANEAFDADSACALIAALSPHRSRIVLYEQPTKAGDLDALREVRERTRILVAADESAKTVEDVLEIHARGAADVVNIKIMKSGVAQSLAMIEQAQRLGLGLMVGGMVEGELAMTVSACIAGGVGGFDFIDLDTPWFLADSPFLSSAFREAGPRIVLDKIRLGHGVDVCMDTAKLASEAEA